MGRRILSVSLLQGSYHYLELDRQSGGVFSQSFNSGVTEEAFLAACRKADDILVNSDFPTAFYHWDHFPKVAKRYYAGMVAQSAKEKMGITEEVQVRFRPVEEGGRGGGAQQVRLGYTAIPMTELQPVWDVLNRFGRKVQFIAPLPVALANMVADLEKPEGNFIVAWAGEEVSFLVISSAEGVVKVARSVPLGLPREKITEDILEQEDPLEWPQIAQSFSQEIFMTTTFFKQEYREGVPDTIYLLGNNNLENLFSRYPLTGAPPNVHYLLSDWGAKGVSSTEANEQVHLLANLHLKEEFNFLSGETADEDRSDLVFKAVVGVLLVLILAAGAWGWLLLEAKNNLEAENNQIADQIVSKQKEVIRLRTEAAQLKPFEGWKRFYEQTYEKRPEWNRIVSELGLAVPDNLIIEAFTLSQDQRQHTRIRGRNPGRVADVAGRINADTWEEGLMVLRDFGERIQGSSIFEVADVQYTPKEPAVSQKTFDFKMKLVLLPGSAAHGL